MTSKSFKKYLLILIIVFVLLRLPSLFEGFWYPDEGFYAAQAEGILRGKTMYLDSWDHKPPLMVWLYLIGGIVGWDTGYPIIKILSIIAGIITILLVQKFLAQAKIKRTIQALLLTLTVLLLGTPILEGNLANSEVFFIPINTAILYLSLYKRKPYLTGILLSLTFLIKPQAFIEGLAIVSLVGIYDLWRQRRKFDTKYYLKLFGTFLSIPLAYLLYTYLSGSLYAFYDATFVTNFLYIREEKGTTEWTVVKLAVALVVFLYALVKLKKDQIAKTNFVVFLVLIVDMVLVSLSGRPYMHYLIQLLPISVISLALYIKTKPKSRLELFEMISGFIVLLAFIFSKGFNFPAIDRERFDGHIRYYSDFPSYLFLNNTDTHSWFWKGHDYFIPQSELVDYFEDNYAGLDYYYYGEKPWIFTQLNGNFVNKYLVWYHLVYSDEKMHEAIERRDKAAILIVDESSDKKLEPFFSDLNEKFTLMEKIYNYSIYANNDYR